MGWFKSFENDFIIVNECDVCNDHIIITIKPNLDFNIDDLNKNDLWIHKKR